eukprot:123416-Amorphochlora_amoeboformis.AAC.1
MPLTQPQPNKSEKNQDLVNYVHTGHLSFDFSPKGGGTGKDAMLRTKFRLLVRIEVSRGAQAYKTPEEVWLGYQRGQRCGGCTLAADVGLFFGGGMGVRGGSAKT